MKEHEIPTCIVRALRDKVPELASKEYYLAHCGRAITFMRIAADEVDNLGNYQRHAEYHAYAGISAARTSIDAAANWLNSSYAICKPSPAVDFKPGKSQFVSKLPATAPEESTFAIVPGTGDYDGLYCKERAGGPDRLMGTCVDSSPLAQNDRASRNDRNGWQ